MRRMNPLRLFVLLLLPVFCLTAGICCKGRARGESNRNAVHSAARTAAPAIPEKDIFTVTSPGRWFPDDPAELRAMVDGFIDKAEDKKIKHRIVALMSPHAGYPYSGSVAGYAYRQLRGLHYDTVVVVGFDHAVRGEGIAAYDRGGFRTPLGVIPIDTEMVNALTKSSKLIKHNPAAFAGEHSLDNQLPFLQRALDDFKLVPLLLTEQTQENIDALAGALAEAAKGKNVLLVASSDMSHFWTHEEAKKLDDETLGPILKMDAEALGKILKDDPSGRRLCGRGDVQAVMRAAKALGADTAHLLHYADSKDTSGYDDPQRGVVGYGAVAFTDDAADPPRAEVKKSEYPGELDETDQKQLLKIARQALEQSVRDGKTPKFENDLPRLENKRGVFVTLNENGELRGCMGHFEADTPLYDIVARQTVMSAFQDPRFPPVREEEVSRITIEISVLSVPEPVNSYEDIVVGRHGVILQKNGRGATFLPQVAPEQGWDRDTMLSQLSLKAGLPGDAWKSGAAYLVYTAQVFGEKE